MIEVIQKDKRALDPGGCGTGFMFSWKNLAADHGQGPMGQDRYTHALRGAHDYLK